MKSGCMTNPRCVWTKLKANGLWKSLSTWFKEGEKKTLNYRSLIRSIVFIIEFIMKLSSLVTLMSFIVFNASFGVEVIFIRFLNAMWKVERVMTQKPCLASQVTVITTILNQYTSLSLPQTVIAHFSYIKCVYLVNQVSFLLSWTHS